MLHRYHVLLLLVITLGGAPQICGADAAASANAIRSLEKALADPPADWAELQAQPWASIPLTRADAQQAREALWQAYLQQIRQERKAEFEAKRVRDDKLEMRYEYKQFGTAPPSGASLWISMHGGGGTTARVNDQQWENQKRLYSLEEGIYLAPRAPTNTWNLWHQEHIDRMFIRLIQNFIAFKNINPNRVYILGYSAGGDGVYQLAPRMAERWAGAAMMAGHPNGVSLLSVRNIAFALQVGADDRGYGRNTVARRYGDTLEKYRKDDPQGYEQFVKIHEGKGHWMNLEDKAALPWMAKYTRNPTPQRVVWKQTGVPYTRAYWLAVPPDQAKKDTLVIAEHQKQRVQIVQAEGVNTVIVRLDDRMLNLDQPITIASPLGETQVTVERTVDTLIKTLDGHGDLHLMFDAEVSVKVKD